MASAHTASDLVTSLQISLQTCIGEMATCADAWLRGQRVFPGRDRLGGKLELYKTSDW